jgi:hypothetical protein
MNNGKLYTSKDISEIKSRFSPSRTVFVTTVEDKATIEDSMKESLNRIDDHKVGNETSKLDLHDMRNDDIRKAMPPNANIDKDGIET